MAETTNVRENTAAVTTLASEAGSAPAGTELTEQTLAGLRASFVADPARVVAQNAVARTDIDEVAVNHARLVEVRRAMSSKLDEWAVTNQKKSGRCWLFAALNLLRFDARKQLGLKEFEFSQAYAMYWDKLERSNFFLQQIVQTAAEPLDGRVVQFLLEVVAGYHDPLERHAENGGGDVIDGGRDVDVRADRPVVDPVAQPDLDLHRAALQLGPDIFAQG